MRIAKVRAKLQRPPVDISGMEVWDIVNLALERVVPGAARLTFGWVGDMLRDTGDRETCNGHDVLGSWLREVGFEVCGLCVTYYD